MSTPIRANYHRPTSGPHRPTSSPLRVRAGHLLMGGIALIGLVLAPGVARSTGTAAGNGRFLIVRGAGDGHGVGMSQWGAYGYARHGQDHRFILSHYYSSTAIGAAPVGSQIRVLLAANRSSVSFSGGSRAGARRLDPGVRYSAIRSGTSAVALRAPDGSTIAVLPAPMRVTGPTTLWLGGTADNGVRDGTYRGALELRPGRAGGLNAVDSLTVDDYVRGVVGREMSSSWPAAALEAQAVAARTYALTAPVGSGLGFDQYADTRSQSFGGVGAETANTDRAVKATAGEVVTYRGRPVTTYYFDSSGGRTEDVQNSFPGTSAEPWLRSVEDPYDTSAPLHRWGPVRISFSQAALRLGGLVRGSFEGITVLSRGRSPRVVTAEVMGSAGTSTVSGQTLAARLGLNDAWAHFSATDASNREQPLPDLSREPAAQGPNAPGPPATSDSGGGQAAPRRAQPPA